jgi:hypothetical protein
MRLNATRSSNNAHQYIIEENNVISVNTVVPLILTSVRKLAASYSVAEATVAINGSSLTTSKDTSVVLPAIDDSYTLDIGTTLSTNFMNSWIKRLDYYNHFKTQDELIALTT